jgi:ABC-2 type transport system ATP-binding protein
VRIEDHATRIIGHLSKGYRQRVGLADTLVHDPEVLILDEPTVGLDPNQVREVRDLVTQLASDRTVLFSTHVIPWVEAVCQRVIIIAKGRIVADAPIEDLTEGLEGGLEEAFRVLTVAGSEAPEPVPVGAPPDEPTDDGAPGDGAEEVQP